jgi:hypothetical protein
LATSLETEEGLEGRPEWADLLSGKSFTRAGLDLGLVWQLPFARHWSPRVGISALNIGGYEAGEGLTGIEFGPRANEFEPPQAGELRQVNTVGVAVSPWWEGIRFTIALDLVDYTRSALPGESYTDRLRLGGEIGLYPHRDGTARLGLLVGWNQGHWSYGVLSRVWIFEVGFGAYTAELGERSGDNPDRRISFVLGFRF